MKITKFEHACLLVEMPEPVNRTVLFDPGSMSEAVLRKHHFEFLDDIVITHEHFDHISLPIVKQLTKQFPNARVTATQAVVEQLSKEGVIASATAAPDMKIISAPHEKVDPLFPTPAEIGIHYLKMLTHPGDSLSFKETMPILALPVEAPWGTTVAALELAIKLKPKHVLPIHDWMWREEWRTQMYDSMAEVLKQHDIVFHKLKTGEPVVIDL